MPATLLSLNIAAARPLVIDGREVMSGIVKRSVAGPVAVRAMGLAGDEQADLSVHGGLSKAVYAYPVEHYGFWQTVRAQAKAAAWDELLPPGAMGENLTLQGLLETGAPATVPGYTIDGMPVEVGGFAPFALLNPAVALVGLWMGRQANQPQKLIVAGFAAAIAGVVLVWLAARLRVLPVRGSGGEAGLFVLQFVVGTAWAAIGYYFARRR